MQELRMCVHLEPFVALKHNLNLEVGSSHSLLPIPTPIMHIELLQAEHVGCSAWELFPRLCSQGVQVQPGTQHDLIRTIKKKKKKLSGSKSVWHCLETRDRSQVLLF